MRSRRSCVKEVKRCRAGVEQEPDGYVVYLGFDGGQTGDEVQWQGDRQEWMWAETDLARAVVDLKGAFAQHIKANYSIDADGKLLLQDGQVGGYDSEVGSVYRT